MTKNKRKTPSREDRALRLLKEAVSEAKIQDRSSYIGTSAYFARYWVLGPKDRGKQLTEFPRERCSVFKVEYPRDIILVIQVNRVEGISFIESSLLLTAIDLIRGAEKILDAPGSDRLFKIESPRDREEAIDFNVRATLVSYMNYLPLMLDKALDGAYEDSIVRQMRTSIQPALRDHWRSIGLPDDFNILSVWERHSYVKQVEEFRKPSARRWRRIGKLASCHPQGKLPLQG